MLLLLGSSFDPLSSELYTYVANLLKLESAFFELLYPLVLCSECTLGVLLDVLGDVVFYADADIVGVIERALFFEYPLY